MAGRSTRELMIEGAVHLLGTRGLQGASLHEVLDYTGAPRGSIYHHFPGGKVELIREALDAAGRRHDEAVAAAPSSIEGIVEAFLAFWRTLLVGSGFESGCPILAVTVAEPDGPMHDKAAEVFERSLSHLAAVLTEAGADAEEAREYATLLLASAEGAVVLARAQRDLAPFQVVESRLRRMMPSPRPA